MDKTNPPETFGVFKPVGHIVIAYRTATDLEAAAGQLREQGFVETDLVRYSPTEMLAQADEDTQSATFLASLGQDLNLVKAHRELAASGCSFLVVKADDDERVEQVTSVAQHTRAVTAQRYGHLIVEELIDPTPDGEQVFESPDRGLDNTDAEQATR